jgi:hypothetical protein
MCSKLTSGLQDQAWIIYGYLCKVIYDFLAFFLQANGEEDEQMDQDEEPHMQIVLHEVHVYHVTVVFRKTDYYLSWREGIMFFH